jgi:Protein of unknown function (DUF1566)
MMSRAMRCVLMPALALLAALASSTAHAAFIDNGDGTVTDTVTALMWDKCPYGQTANDCSGGSAFRFRWAAALVQSVAVNGITYKGHNDWRLPNIRELESLVKIGLTNPAIDDVAFPNTDVSQSYWSSTLAVHDSTAWAVPFQTGDVNTLDRTLQANNSFARFVRGGHPNDAFDLVSAPSPTLQAVVSRRVHGAAGTFDLPLSTVVPPAINHNPTTEPRQGPAQTIVFTFDKPLNAATVTLTEGTAVAAAPTFTGNSVVVALSSVADQQYVTVSLTNVNSTDGGTGGSASVRVGFLLGDVNQNRVVTLADLGLVNAQLAQPVTAANYLKDVNASGTMTLADKGITNTNLTKALPVP